MIAHRPPRLVILLFCLIALGIWLFDSNVSLPGAASSPNDNNGRGNGNTGGSSSKRFQSLNQSVLDGQRARTGIAFATFDPVNNLSRPMARPRPPDYWKDQAWLDAMIAERARFRRQRFNGNGGTAGSDTGDDDAWVRDFVYEVGPDRLELHSDCGVPAHKLAAFELQWDRWQRIHAEVLAGEREPRFVHVGFPHKSSVLNRLKTTVSAFMLALVTDRAFLLSWTRNEDPDSVYRHHLPVEHLFLAPPFNWTYDFERYHQARWQRFNVTGFGLEDYVETEPLHELFCSDFTHQRRDTVWWEFPWKYGWAGSLFYHSPYVHALTDPLFGRRDMFGWLARKLFRPHPRIWSRIMHFRRTHFRGYRVVGIELSKGHAGLWQFQQMLNAINRDIETRPEFWEGAGAGAGADVGGLIKAPRTKLFLVLHDKAIMKQIVKKFGSRFQFLYYPHRNFGEPGDDGELIDSFLLGLTDIVFATPWYTSPLGAFFSKQAHIVAPGGNAPVVADPQCQPCISMSGVAKSTCYSSKMDFPEPSSSNYKCTREYPIF